MLETLRCKVGLHTWREHRNPEHGWYRECAAFGKQGDVPGSGGGAGLVGSA